MKLAAIIALLGCVGVFSAYGEPLTDLRVTALGTSLTRNGGWPGALVSAALAQCGKRLELQDLSAAGENSTFGLSRLEELAAFKPDWVLVEFSANDASLLHGVTLAQSALNIGQIIAGVRQAHSQAQVVLMAMNPMWGLRGWTRPRLDAFYDVYAEISHEQQVRFIDFRPLWLTKYGSELDRVIPDGVHPLPAIATQVVVAPLLTVIISDCERLTH